MTTDRPWALILGASSGFGAASARALAAQGWPILGVHLDLRATVERAAEVQRDCETLGVPVRMYNRNAADPKHISAILDDLPPGSRVGLVLHSLAFGSTGPLVFPREGRVRHRNLAMTLDVMALSLVSWIDALLDRQQLPAGARVLAMTSGGSLAALPGYGPVAAAKAALEALVRQLAAELAPSGVTVNAIMAGVTDTPALRRIPGWEQLVQAALRRNPHGRLTTPDDVAQAVVALTHPGLAWLTGDVLRIDGGESSADGFGA